MSKNDKQKELNEENCLKRACALAKNKKAKTRNILKMLEGESVVRTKNDSPDIIKKCEIKGETVFIGIEHFLVDQTTITKSGKTKSLAQEHRNHIMRDYNEGHALYEKNETIPQELMKKLAEDTYQYAAAVNRTGYDELLFAFRSALNKHLSKVADYRKTVEAYAGTSKVKLAFLIEVHCFAMHLFLNNGRNTKHNPDALIPMFTEIVGLLEEIDSSAVDYVILYLQNVSDRNIANVIALETCNISGGLRSQAIPVYEYSGGMIPIKYVKHNIEQNNSNAYSLGYEVLPECIPDLMNYLLPALQKAHFWRTQGKPFAAPRNIQSMMYAFGNDVSFSQDEKGNMRIKTSYSQDEVIKRYEEFMTKYAIEENEHEPIG